VRGPARPAAGRAVAKSYRYDQVMIIARRVDVDGVEHGIAPESDQ
jgi:hypothetical protein